MVDRENHKYKLESLSPLDGRYREDTVELSNYFSESALIKTRIEVETRYLIALSDAGAVSSLQENEKTKLRNFVEALTNEDLTNVKKLESESGHDVKAVERYMRQALQALGLDNHLESLHYGLTSEDVNNISYRLMIDRSRSEQLAPELNNLTDELIEKADEYKSLPMIGRTHGQAAVPTTLGKELAVFAYRLNDQVQKSLDIKFAAKLNGAVGNYNAHHFVYPDIKWVEFSEKFITSFGFEPALLTTQTAPYEDLVEYFQSLQRVNNVILDLDRDMWRYISDGYLIQESDSNEVGSSTMPQKINPIQFENSEGNLKLANGIWDVMVRELPISRLQRDLSDSTILRNVGVGVGHGLLGYKNTIRGLKKIAPDTLKMSEDLNSNWSILSEGAQTLLRNKGVEDPYSKILQLIKGKQLSQDQWIGWVDDLQVDDSTKQELRDLTPEQYTGLSSYLVEMAIKKIKLSKNG